VNYTGKAGAAPLAAPALLCSCLHCQPKTHHIVDSHFPASWPHWLDFKIEVVIKSNCPWGKTVHKHQGIVSKAEIRHQRPWLCWKRPWFQRWQGEPRQAGYALLPRWQDVTRPPRRPRSTWTPRRCLWNRESDSRGDVITADMMN
jgi:hypothetical protein